MNLKPVLDHRTQVEQFLLKHRTGLLTLLFTDIVGSTALKQGLGDTRAVLNIQRHHALVRETLQPFTEAEEISTAGDSFFIVFAKPSDAVKFALLLQAAVRGLAAQIGLELADRIGVHLGEVFIEEREDVRKPKDLFGLQVDACARVMSLAQGGQILLTRSPFDNARQVLKGRDLPGLESIGWLNHGLYVFQGVEEALEICEVGECGHAPLQAPPNSEKAQRHVSPDQEPVLGWRPAAGQGVPGTGWVLEEKLGEGGFGEVWLGYHERLKERRVFKFCFRADRVRSLRREVTLFRLLKERVGEHPNIVSVREVFFEEPPYYIEIDYVAGRDLKTWCEAQGGLVRVPMEARLAIVAQIAEGLQAAHEAGVIHRDIKPGNILVSQRAASSDLPLAKLTDFGIGQVVSEEILQSMTRSGFTQTLLASGSSQGGTHMYMAPELVAGQPASTRSDIYSLGVVLYQMTVGSFQKPLSTDWAEEILDPLVRADLKRCFAGDPQGRFAAAGQLAEHLRRLPDRRADLDRQQAESAARERAAYRRAMLQSASIAAVIVAVVVVLANYAFKQTARIGELAGMAFQQATRAEKFGRDAGFQKRQAERVAEDLKRLLYAANMNLAQLAWEQKEVDRLRALLAETQTFTGRGFEWYYWQRMAHLGITQEAPPQRGDEGANRLLGLSPFGGRTINDRDDRTATTLDALSGGPMIKLQGNPDPVHAMAISPDGKRALGALADGTTKVWEIATSRELLTLRGHRAAVHCAAWSPDGQRILTGSRDTTARLWDALSGRELLTLRGHADAIRAVAFSADGRQVITGAADGTAKVWEGATPEEVKAWVLPTVPGQ